MKTQEQKRRNGKRFTIEQKREVLNAVNDLGMTQDEAAVRFGTTTRSINTWQTQHKKIFDKGNAETIDTLNSKNSKNSKKREKSNDHETLSTKDTNKTSKEPKNTNGTTENETTIIYRDSVTGETLLQSNNCAYFGGTWERGEEGEVIMDVKRVQHKNNPGSTKPESNLVEPTDNPNNTVDTLNEIMSNDWMKILVPLGIGAAGWIVTKNKSGKNDDKNW